ncbi:MAG TPA: cytochrome c biogenesis protein CcdA [Treponema sp.]|nr:cytochrome c biogenesis protein CcdA [Treponema sp.]
MGQVPGIALSFAAGLLSFLSPCVLPLIPVFLSFITGESILEKSSREKIRYRLLVRTLLFVAGFSIVFVLLALVFGGGMRFLGSSASLIITRISGVIVLLLGINLLFNLLPFLAREFRIDTAGKLDRLGWLRAPLFGMAFAAGWTPCIGPILSTILLYAGQSGNAAHAAILLAAYSFGLGIPFILTGLFFDRATPILSWFKRHMRAVRIISGLLLIAFGLAILTGGLSGITTTFMKLGYAVETLAETGPEWFRPIATFFARWLTFQGV